MEMRFRQITRAMLRPARAVAMATGAVASAALASAVLATVAVVSTALMPAPARAAAPETRSAAPPAAAQAAADTSAFDLAAYRGQVVYLDFWASWCVPCKHSFPWMSGMQERFGNRGLAVVAVNLDRDPKAAAEFLKKNPVPFRIVYDPRGDMAKAYKVEVMPSSFLFDRTGRQRTAHQGFKESERVALETQILDLLAESPPDSTKR